MKHNFTLYTSILIACGAMACSQLAATEKQTNQESTADNKSSWDKAGNISFLAFGDGGYHPDYPKIKHIKKPRNKEQFIEKERKDWLEDYRPIEEFDHAPIYVYPNTETATEDTGAAAVGLAMAEVCKLRTCEFAIQLGDNIYPDGADANDGKDDQKRMDDLILKPLLPLLADNKDMMVYSALGNHDWKSSRKGVALQTEWMKNQPNFYLDEKGYYQYKVGEQGNDVEFFVLDTNMLLSAQPIYEVPLNPDGSEMELEQAKLQKKGELEYAEPHENPVKGENLTQLAWLKHGLENSTAKWKVVYGHHILWSIGGTKYSEGHVLRKLIMPTLCENADAYIAGHEHDLELLTDDCSKYGHSDKPPLPLIISGAASKMRGKHSPFARFQEKHYPEYDLVWSKSFVWGFAHITLDNQADSLNIDYFTTPRDQSGKAINEGSFSFKKRTN
ncbi:metallophosphoesterase [Pseudocolwellia sp. AS88]|uniref:metallophosphoesterase n=1 Tax=Pseudocolwellia sp. AS88 TaxID=3063958 RepID=UPI0026F1DC1D|nr:metallophosphoesterase [Pseudocolwellia sp. AS88]MDO7085719.1 metallophosphoesterase [Pseudocolwellia sp. AS88]